MGLRDRFARTLEEGFLNLKCARGLNEKNELFIERRKQGDYAMRRPNSHRASGVEETPAEAIDRARSIAPGSTVFVERVRYTSRGTPDKWRKPWVTR
jgi:hypothetical protein